VKNNVQLLSHLNQAVVKNIRGFKLDAYLIALEGWRRVLTLKWYKAESPICTLDKVGSPVLGNFFSLSSSNNTHYFFRSRGDLVENKTVRLCSNKEKTKEILSRKGISVPEGQVFNVMDNRILEYSRKIGFPVVIKPKSGSMGKGVYTNIESEKELKDCLSDYKSVYRYNEVIVEKHYEGNEYRIYVVGNKAIGATNRIPANIIGDGEHNISQLIELKNKERKKNPYLAKKPIKPDYEVHQLLNNSGFDMNSIPSKDQLVMLREKSNLSSGGDPIEATDELSPEIRQLAVEALRALPSIPHAGVDIIVNPDEKDKGVVLEINGTAEIAFHVFPLRGNAINLPKAIIDYYFPEVKHVAPNYCYFDFNSVLEPLKSWATDELQVTNNPIHDFHQKKFIVSGKILKVGYMNWIKRQALRKGLHGHVKKIKGGKLEIIVFGNNEEKLIAFKDLCYKGSKQSEVTFVEELKVQNANKPVVKIGFEIFT